MRNNLLIITIALLLAGIVSACKKGEDIRGTGYGRLQVASVFAGDASPLLIKVDGQTADTLNVDKPGTLKDIILKTGKHRLVLVNGETKTVLTDTTIVIETTKTISLPKFFYTGTAALFDDTVAKPAKDSMLVRFVTLDPTLPDVMNLEISLWDFGGTPIPLTSKKLTGVRKDKFTGFIQFPNQAASLPADADPSFFFYVIEAFDAKDGKKVMSIADGSISYVADENFSPFVANAVISLGIGKQPDYDPTHVPQVIFNRLTQ